MEPRPLDLLFSTLTIRPPRWWWNAIKLDLSGTGCLQTSEIFPYPDYSKWRCRLHEEREHSWRWCPIFWSLLSQARRPNRTVSIETKSPKLNTTLPQKPSWTEYGLICSQLPNVILVLQSSDLGFQTLSSFADDSGTLDKSKSLSKARRRIIGGKITHWLDR